MLKVGIFTRYSKNEVTLAAVQLADWLLRCGIEVVMLADGKPTAGVHAEWDINVKAFSQEAAFKWAYGATHLCWFSPDLKALNQVQLVCNKNKHQLTKHIFFPNWHDWNDDHVAFLKRVTRVIALSNDMGRWLKYKDYQLNTEATSTWANLVSADQVLVPRIGRVDKDHVKLLCVLQKSVITDIGCEIVEVFSTLLTDNPNLIVTVVLESAWSISNRRQLYTVSKLFSKRLKVIKNPPYYDYVEIAREHDLVYLSSTRHMNGSTFSALVVSSVPLICHDVPPVAAHVEDKKAVC